MEDFQFSMRKNGRVKVSAVHQFETRACARSHAMQLAMSRRATVKCYVRHGTRFVFLSSFDSSGHEILINAFRVSLDI